MTKNILCLIDLQKEYEIEGRPFCIPGVSKSLKEISKLVTVARINKWPILHVRHLQESGLFASGSPEAEFINGFEPQVGELTFTKNNFSCFADPNFTESLKKYKDHKVLVAGYGSTMCCMSTILEGYHRGYKMVFVANASDAKPSGTFDSSKLHEAATHILSTFCEIVQTDDVLKM